MRILHKLAIASLIFMLPIGVLLYFLLSGLNDALYNTRLELWGTELLKPLLRLVELIPAHRRLSGLYLAGDTTLRDDLEAVEKEVEEAFSVLVATADRFAVPLQIDTAGLEQAQTEEILPVRIQSQWQRLRSTWHTLSPVRNEEEHRSLLTLIQGLTRRTGDASRLVLDSDLDSHYLIDVVLMAMPKAQERMSDVLTYAERVLARGRITLEDSVQFAVFAAMLKESDLQHIRQSVAAALREDKNFYGVSGSLQDNISPLMSRYELSVRAFRDVLEEVSTGSVVSVRSADFVSLGQGTIEAGARLREGTIQELRGLLERRISVFERRRFLALSLSLIVLVAAAALTVLISRDITSPLARVTRIAGEIASGDLERAKQNLAKAGPLRSAGMSPRESQEQIRDEVWRLFDAVTLMTYSLDSLLTQVGKSSTQVDASAAHIEAAVLELETAVAQQVASTHEVTSTSKEICATAQSLAQTMGQLTDMASKTTEFAGAGQVSLDEIKATMQTLLKAGDDISQKLRAVSEKTANIDDVITAITKVASQTNLLSLNAAIEAEKAGQYGVGFSVVAREIRRLADQTAVAALDIEGMIKEMQSAVQDGVEGMRRYAAQMRASSDKVAAISGDLGQIIEHTTELGPQFKAVNQSMQVQSQGAGQISDAMGQLNQAARQTSASLAEFRSIIDQLHEAVEGLQHEVARFSISA